MSSQRSEGEIDADASTATTGPGRRLRARLQSFDSYWQAPKDVESGYARFYRYYKHNYLRWMPKRRTASTLVVSCGPGYFVDMLVRHGYRNVLGIDSDPTKIGPAIARNLDCRHERAFPFLSRHRDEFDVIVAEQELNHLTLDEQVEFLTLCRQSLRDGGRAIVYGLNGANPFMASENRTGNIDHFNTFTANSLRQILELAGFSNVEVMPLRIYVFWGNPLNYVGLASTCAIELFVWLVYKLYGKDVDILSKKLAAVAFK